MQKLLNKLTPETRGRLRLMGRVIQVLFTAGVLYGAGGVTGFWIRDNIAQERRAALLEDHRRELERTNTAYADSLRSQQATLQYLTGRVAQAATTVDSAAATSEAAAVAAQKAASTAQKAVSQSNIAINKAAQVPEPTRDQINSAVKRANRGQK